MIYQIGRIVLGSMCVGVSVWLGWNGIRVAGFSFFNYHNDARSNKHKNRIFYVVLFLGNIDQQGVKKSDSKSKKNDNNGVKKKKTR